jgi:hypothetical protein
MELTLEQYIEYRNRVYLRANAVGRHAKRYYAIRLQYIDSLYPEFAKFGVIKLKKPVKQGIKAKVEAGIEARVFKIYKLDKKIQQMKHTQEVLKTEVFFKQEKLK